MGRAMQAGRARMKVHGQRVEIFQVEHALSKVLALESKSGVSSVVKNSVVIVA